MVEAEPISGSELLTVTTWEWRHGTYGEVSKAIDCRQERILVMANEAATRTYARIHDDMDITLHKQHGLAL